MTVQVLTNARLYVDGEEVGRVENVKFEFPDLPPMERQMLDHQRNMRQLMCTAFAVPRRLLGPSRL